ncbi:MAG: tannase/feruloyl esterase family alpha/beta hydrolase [Burkholderiales bacterium PBB6]|nr:MAG: tannase/feruloyl esterase family alpha/beta hydrolase [Burkholderiales bacterium PBB6]
MHAHRFPARRTSIAALACCALSAAAHAAPAQPATFQGACEDLPARLTGLANTVITASTTVAAGALQLAGQPVAEHCRVTGAMNTRVSPVDGKTYAIAFEMRLPKGWNGRFFHQGNGGIDGAVVTATGALGGGPRTGALMQGFAVLSSDAGHTLAQGGPAFGLDPQARLDYGYQAVRSLTPMAKQLITAAYAKGPDSSYFGGCSNGGRHALVAAARAAQEYDGFLAGAPGYRLPLAALANIWGAQRYATVATGDTKTAAGLETAFTSAERSLVANAVVARCDALDGAADGMVQDTAACQKVFRLRQDVPTCTAATGRDGSCLTKDQKSVVASIFKGATTKSGTPFYAGFPYDGGTGASGIASWEFGAPLTRDSGAVGAIFKVPPSALALSDGPTFSMTLDVDQALAELYATNATYTESAMDFMTPPSDKDLGELRDRGGKIMVYHGVSDPIFSVTDTEAWYRHLLSSSGGKTSAFARLYRVPGMGHCSGGPATDQVDFLSPLVAWVEQGVAPQALVATARGAGNAGGVNADVPASWAADRTRPLCPFPQVARYKGNGDVERAENWSCQSPKVLSTAAVSSRR